MRAPVTIAQMIASMAILSANWQPMRATGWSHFGGAPMAATSGKKRWKRLRRNR